MPKSPSATTLTSFYTIAEQNRAQKLNPQLPPQTSRHTHRAPHEPHTPHLCLPAKLTQILFNRATICFILLAVFAHSLAQMVILGLELQLPDPPQPIAPTTQGVVKFAAQTIDTTNQQALDTANTSVTNLQHQAKAHVKILAQGYNAAAQLAVQSGHDAAQNATDSVHKWTQSKLDDAVASTNDSLSNLADALKKIQQTLDDSLFKNTEVNDDVAKISLEPFKSISVPTDINLNFTTTTKADYGFNKIANHIIFSIDSLSLPTEFEKFNQSRLAEPQTQDNLTTLKNAAQNAAHDSNQNQPVVSNSRKKIKSQVRKVEKSCLAVSIVLALLSVCIAACHEYHRWQWMVFQSKSKSPTIEMLHRSNSPVPFWIGDKISKFTSARAYQSTMWTVNYVLSPACISLAGMGLLLTLMYIMANALISPMRESVVMGHMAIESNWTKSVNNVISQVENTTNSQLYKYYSTANSHVHAALVDAQSTMYSQLKKQLPFGSVIPTELKSNLSTMLYVPARIPRVPPLSTSYAPQEDPVLELKDIYDYLAGMLLQLGLGLFAAWLGIVVVATVYSIIKLKYV